MTLTMTTVTHIERERRDVSAARAQLSRRTKIVATLGPATDPPGVLDALISAGLDVARVNCSHGTAQDVRRRAASVRQAADRAGRPIALLLDLQGPKIRLADIEPRTVSVGDEVVFASTGLAQPNDLAIELNGFVVIDFTARKQVAKFELPESKVAFEVDDIDAAIVTLMQRGVEFDMDKTESPVCWMAQFRDPDGNKLVLHKRKS